MAAKHFLRFAERQAVKITTFYGLRQTVRNRMILGTDQGAIVSANGGETWSDWFNQPTGQLYHVTTDKHVSVSRLRGAAG